MNALSLGAATLAVAIGISATAHADAPDEATRARGAVAASVGSLEQATARVRAMLRRARTRGRADEIACLDAALTRVDVAARYGRDHAQRALAAWREGDATVARQETLRLAWRVEASREASLVAEACAPADEHVVARPGTTVRVWIDPALPRDAPSYP